MNTVKRILWIDDVKENEACTIFPVEETHIVSTMDEALNEIASDRLYEYDTIVLDIDFTNGLKDALKVLERLKSRIYLSPEQETNEFIIENGGYLLYLFLLEQGYPSNRVAFLTGNKGMIAQLKLYAAKNAVPLSAKEIADAFMDAYNPDDEDSFFDMVDTMPIHSSYKQSDFTNDCADKLADGDYAGLLQLIESISTPSTVEPVKNTGDIMIERFHRANLESPVYFSKKEHSIYGHNRTDARNWLMNRRTDDQVARWLFLCAGKFIEKEFNESTEKMKSEIQNLFYTENGHVQTNSIPSDKGIRSAFVQTFYVLSGLRSEIHPGIYFQAVSAMLVPFEATITFPEWHLKPWYTNCEISLRRCLAFCSKEARNYCFHNYFGTTIHNKLALFILLIEVTAILTPNRREKASIWYEKQECALLELVSPLNLQNKAETTSKAQGILNSLIENNSIDFSKLKKGADDFLNNNYTSVDLIYALGNNVKMSKIGEYTNEDRENYYAFTLAACILNHVVDFSHEDILRVYGREMLRLCNVAEAIVNDYEYPV